MDFSNIKKIFYIIAIISMLLSIKSKVLGASIDLQEGQESIEFKIPQFVVKNNYNVFCTVSKFYNYKYVTFIFSQEPITLTYKSSNQSYSFTSNNYIYRSYLYITGSENDIQTDLNKLTTKDLTNTTTNMNWFLVRPSTNNSDGVVSYISTYDVKEGSNLIYKSNYSKDSFAIENSVDTVISTITTDSLWLAFQGVIPVLAIIIIISLAIYFIRKTITSATNNVKTKI